MSPRSFESSVAAGTSLKRGSSVTELAIQSTASSSGDGGQTIMQEQCFAAPTRKQSLPHPADGICFCEDAPRHMEEDGHERDMLAQQKYKVAREENVPPASSGTDVTHLTVDRDGQVRDHLGQPVPCLDNESSLCYNDSRVASNDKLMNCLYFHSESSKGKKEDVRYSGPPPLVGAPPVALDDLHVKCRAPAKEAADANPTASVEVPDLQTCASPKQKRDSNNVSRQTTASSAC